MLSDYWSMLTATQTRLSHLWHYRDMVSINGFVTWNSRTSPDSYRRHCLILILIACSKHIRVTVNRHVEASQISSMPPSQSRRRQRSARALSQRALSLPLARALPPPSLMRVCYVYLNQTAWYNGFRERMRMRMRMRERSSE